MKGFSSITFADVKAAPLAVASIEFAGTAVHILFAKTNSGNFAKFRVRTSYNLEILDLTVYDPAGTIIKTAANVTIQGTCLCDLDQATQAGAASADFHWSVPSPARYSLAPQNGALFFAVTEDATIDFNLITFLDVRDSELSSSTIDGTHLPYRIVFAKTNQGNYAKLQLRIGYNLNILRLTLYDPEGCIIKTAANITIPGTSLCDLDQAAQATGAASADFHWNVLSMSPEAYELVPQNGAIFHVYRGFDDVTFNEIKSAPFETTALAVSALTEQTIFLRTSHRGSFAKVLLNYSSRPRGGLDIRRLVIYDGLGRVLLDERNLTLQDWQRHAKDERFLGFADFQLFEHVSRTPVSFSPVNGAAISFASHFRMTKYAHLLQNAAIANSLVFCIPGDTARRSFSAWTAEEKLLLHEFLYAVDIDADLPLSGPPALSVDQYISHCDGLKIYLAHVAQSLWFEANKLAGWRLASLTRPQLDRLLHVDYLFGGCNAQGYDVGVASNGAHQWNPRFSYRFMANRISANDQFTTIKALLEWCRANLKHISGYTDPNQPGGPFASSSDQFQYIYGFRAAPLVDRMIEPLAGREHVTAGCGCTAPFLAFVLRTVNIPVIVSMTWFGNLADPNAPAAAHVRAQFPTVGQNLAHADDPYTTLVQQGRYQQPIPIASIFYTDADLAAKIDSPTPLPGLTKQQTTTYYHDRKFWEIAIQYTADGLLYQRCFDLHSGALPILPRELGAIGYTAAQIRAVQNQCDVALADIASRDHLTDGCVMYKPTW